MSDANWARVDAYFETALTISDPILDKALAASAAKHLPEIQVSACQGKFLMMLARLRGTRRILEIGTLGGYSTIWLARGLSPGGTILTLEYDAKHAAVALRNIEAAGFADRVDIRVGPALDLLPKIKGPFDFIFVDADKQNNPAYFQWAMKLASPGAVIVIDNVVREGGIADTASSDPAIRATRQMFELIAAQPRVTATALQTVGIKGYDGFAVLLVEE